MPHAEPNVEQDMVAQPRVASLLACLVLLLGCAGCSTPTSRDYYAPLGVPAAREIASELDVDRAWRVETRCQGSYGNVVAGRSVRTIHLQLEVTCTAPRPMVVPLVDVSLELIDELGRSRQLALSEAWSGSSEITGELIVNAFSRQPLDFFFDEPRPLPAEAQLVRLRWRHRDGDRWRHHDCQFQRVAEGDPRGPTERPPADLRYGYRDGWYMSGLGDLGRRRIVKTPEQRSHYVFHTP